MLNNYHLRCGHTRVINHIPDFLLYSMMEINDDDEVGKIFSLNCYIATRTSQIRIGFEENFDRYFRDQVRTASICSQINIATC